MYAYCTRVQFSPRSKPTHFFLHVNAIPRKAVAESATCFYSCANRRLQMRFILGLLVGYCIRGKQRLLIATLTITVGCFIVLPAIALSLLALDVRRERLS